MLLVNIIRIIHAAQEQARATAVDKLVAITRTIVRAWAEGLDDSEKRVALLELR